MWFVYEVLLKDLEGKLNFFQFVNISKGFYMEN